MRKRRNTGGVLTLMVIFVLILAGSIALWGYIQQPKKEPEPKVPNRPMFIYVHREIVSDGKN